MKRPNRFSLAPLCFFVLFAVQAEISSAQNKTAGAGLRFNISFPATKSVTPLDGRVLLMLSADSTQEPRFQITDDEETQLLFGVNVDGLKPNVAAIH